MYSNKATYDFQIINEGDTTSFTYDTSGNLILDDTYYYEYNGYNQLYRVRIDNSSGTILEQYLYDENGNRAVKIHYFTGGTNETVFYFGDYVTVVNSSGVFNTIEYYAGDKLVAERKNDSTMSFYHPDHLGSTSLITNSTGGLVENTIYEPFGSVFLGGSKSRFDYTGKETDDTGLQYFGARFYNPAIGKWTQADTLISNYYDPQGLNRYSFVLNNPYKYTDPDGHDSREELYYAKYRPTNDPQVWYSKPVGGVSAALDILNMVGTPMSLKYENEEYDEYIKKSDQGNLCLELNQQDETPTYYDVTQRDKDKKILEKMELIDMKSPIDKVFDSMKSDTSGSKSVTKQNEFLVSTSTDTNSKKGNEKGTSSPQTKTEPSPTRYVYSRKQATSFEAMNPGKKRT
jgi:RHS repeat-associated protein